MKRVRELTRDDSDASLFPCKRLRQLQSALGHRYEKRFVPSYPFDAALDSDPDAADLAHPDTAHSSPAGTTANLSWTTDVAGESAEGSSLSQVPCARTVTSRLLPARWEDSDAESDLDSEPDPTPDADMDLASSPSASPPPTHVGRFGFGFQHRERVARKSGVAAGVGTVSCAHPVLCCAMCGMRVLRAMCEVGIQVEAIHYEYRAWTVYAAHLSLPVSSAGRDPARNRRRRRHGPRRRRPDGPGRRARPPGPTRSSHSHSHSHNRSPLLLPSRKSTTTSETEVAADGPAVHAGPAIRVRARAAPRAASPVARHDAGQAGAQGPEGVGGAAHRVRAAAPQDADA
ncbi:uncharacterized protein C8Q71DRAFT_408543 [Rhodofomes roseus]|uniref:Uncharacterized protein n=1 Tax=Rhodofomes roseus TaxID=34475 RepID=A0ABQ8JYL7_9APHY|nr:uncharacterized protein C8Q71DRAFT_408543 [Rhodofomes roseus]KAH9829359.1 hypothetical protein C8Q71DRAFT_408543 [Rhodofomes roseus]